MDTKELTLEDVATVLWFLEDSRESYADQFEDTCQGLRFNPENSETQDQHKYFKALLWELERLTKKIYAAYPTLAKVEV
ncbi:MAG: hypothetical protein LUD69_01635 [Oscillospiraceae bacterium]|nr:hypothetical protein [Oscillospiraceae bacterium]